MFEKFDKRIQSTLKKLGIVEATLIQEMAVDKILAGMNCLLVSETGTGKTLAVLLPIFQLWLKQKPDPVSILYITPMKSLNRDMLEHLIHWGKELEMEVTVRHGDTSQHERRMQQEFPHDMMIVTLETLQPILSGKKIREHLRNIRYVIIDEVHEIADSKRGVQLAIALERLKELCGDFQLIMLSATVGDPDHVANFFSGGRLVDIITAKTDKPMDIQVIRPDVSAKDSVIARKVFTSTDTAARLRTIMDLIKNSRSTLVFTNTREFAEILSSRIKTIDKNFPLEVHHSSLSKDVRIEAEKNFKQEKLKALLATSSLQLGIDVGSVDLVIQYMSPRTVTQLTQRVGRSGHAMSKISKGIIVSTDEDDIFEAAVIARKALTGELEKPNFHEASLDVLAHQILGLTMDVGRIDVEKAYNIIKRAYPYKNMTHAEFLEVCKQLQRLGLIFLDGTINKRRRGFEYYFTQLSTIPSVKRYQVINMLTNSFVGSLDEEFVAIHGDTNTTFIFKGEPWKIISVEEGRVMVEPVSDIEAAIPGWEGELIPVPYAVAQEVGKLRSIIKDKIGESNKEIITDIQHLYPVDENCAKEMLSVIKSQKKSGIVPDDKTIVVEDFDELVIIHACFGTNVNETLGRFLTSLLTSRVGSVGLKTDPYRIMLQFQQKNTELIREILFNTNPSHFQSYLEMSLTNSELFEWKFVHVAKRFGAITSDAEYGKIRMKRIIEDYAGTPIYKETLKELETEKLDIPIAIDILKKIQSKEIAVIFKTGLSPLGRIGVKHKYAEVVGPQKPEMELFELFRQRILDSEVRLICCNCGEWDVVETIREMKEKTKCKKCDSKLLAVLKPQWIEARKIIKKGVAGKKMDVTEKKRFERAVQRADLFIVYGKKAAIALAGHGIGPTTARRILAHPYKDEDDLLKAVLQAERQFIKTRKFWAI
jgi:ATP-dependent Lhr-like helicase